MASAEQRGERPRENGKRPWQRPRLVVHGDLRTLTQAKGGTRSDGGGAKPNTRATGKPA